MTPLGLQFADHYNNISGVIPIINSPHPVFAGNPAIFQDIGQSIIDLDPSDDKGIIIASDQAHGLYAVFDPGFAASGGHYRYPAQAVDPDGDVVKYQLITFPIGMWIDPPTGFIRWAPTADQIGTHDVTVMVQDGRGGSNSQSYLVCVLPDAAPVIIPHESLDLTVANVTADSLVFDRQSLLVTGTVAALVINCGPGSTRVPFDVLFFEDRNRNGAYDSGIDDILGKTSVSGSMAAGQSNTVTAQLFGVVQFAGAPVWAFVDSGNAIAETDEGNNVARPACQATPQVGQFNPVIEWKKDAFSVLPDSKQVMMTPAVIDLNGDHIPDIVFSTFTGGSYTGGGRLRAISGADGTELWTVTNPSYPVSMRPTSRAGFFLPFDLIKVRLSTRTPGRRPTVIGRRRDANDFIKLESSDG